MVSVNAGAPWPASPATAVLPQVTGMDINTAVAMLTADGLSVDATTASPTGSMVVATQVPGAAATVTRSSTATLTVGDPHSNACKTS